MTEDIQRTAHLTADTCLRHAIQFSREAGRSFALWKLPNASSIQFAGSGDPIGTHDVTLEDSKPGFLFAPFDPGEKKLFLPADDLFVLQHDQLITLQGELGERIAQAPAGNRNAMQTEYYVRPVNHNPATNEAYLHLVSQCRDAVMRGEYEKLVPSRCKEEQLPEDFDLVSLFMELGRRYPAAMVSVFSSPQTGTWIGATPEMLVSVDAQQHFHTVAVAGTQPYVPGTDLRSITWSQKEIEEQALVERYIISCFKKIRLREFDERGPRTVVAGNVVHLKTEFEVDMVATRYPQLGTVMLQLLHPTSAVCGMPMESSLAFLKQHEGYARQFYSGFLGPVNINNETRLFVNLRCMQLGSGTARLYAGGGVLAESDPEKEWQETELKMNTLLNVIRH